MSETLTKHPKAGSAAVFTGDPRKKNADIDTWWNGLLSSSEGAKSRPYLYGSDAGLCARKNVLLEHNTWIPFGNYAPECSIPKPQYTYTPCDH